MTSNEVDFVNYSNFFRGNRRKGLERLETILQDPTLAGDLVGNASAGALFLFGKGGYHKELLYLFKRYGYGDALVSGYCAASGRGHDDLLGSATDDTLVKVYAISPASRGVVSAGYAGRVPLDLLLEYCDADAELVEALVSDSAMFDLILNSEYGDAFLGCEAVNSAIASSPSAIMSLWEGERAASLFKQAAVVETISNSPEMLNALCKSDAASVAFMDNADYEPFFENFKSCVADTSYFTPIATALKSGSSTYYSNSKTQNSSTELSPDACIAVAENIPSYMSMSGSTYYVYRQVELADLSADTVRYTGTAQGYDSTNIHQTLVLRGVRHTGFNSNQKILYKAL